jgi:hypothetical protein
MQKNFGGGVSDKANVFAHSNLKIFFPYVKTKLQKIIEIHLSA